MIESYDNRYKAALKKEHSKLFDGETLKPQFKEELNKCPVCNTVEYKIYCIKDSFVHKRCTKCSLVYLDPKLNREATLAFYNSEVNEIYNEQKFHFEQTDEIALDDGFNFANFEKIKSVVKDLKGKKLLEIGSAKGIFLQKAKSEGLEVYGVELNTKMIEHLKTITPNIYSDDVINLDLPENYFDIIYHRDVMEHIDMPIPFLEKLKKVLKPGGILVIDTHNIESLVNSYTKEFHTVVFPFEHPLHWSPKSLKYAANMVGLKFKKLFMDHEYQTLKEILDYHSEPTFTFIYPKAKSKYFQFFSWKVRKYYNKFKFIKSLDQFISSSISKILGKGAKMQIVFTK